MSRLVAWCAPSTLVRMPWTGPLEPKRASDSDWERGSLGGARGDGSEIGRAHVHTTPGSGRRASSPNSNSSTVRNEAEAVPRGIGRAGGGPAHIGHRERSAGYCEKA